MEYHIFAPGKVCLGVFSGALATFLALVPVIGRSAPAPYAASPLASGFSGGVIAVNPVTNEVYVGAVAMSSDPMEPGGQFPLSAGLAIIDAGTKASSTIGQGIWSDIKVNPVTNKIYVAGSIVPIGGGIMVIDAVTNATALVPIEPEATAVAVAVNPVTNKIYALGIPGVVTVVDGATNATAAVPVGGDPGAIAINEVTNQIYVTNGSANYVTIIDGATNATTAVDIGGSSWAVAVNSITNRIYVGGSGIKMIDGATNASTTVAAAPNPFAIALNPVTNKIYALSNGSADVTVIDGATNAASSVAIASLGTGLVVNPVTNQVFVSHPNDSNVTVIDGSTNAVTAIGIGSTTEEGDGAAGLALNPVTNSVYVPTLSGVYVINGTGQSGSPSFSSQPTAATVSPGVPAVLNAFAGGPSSTTYLWLKDGAPLSDGGGIEGCSTSTLFLSGGATLADTGCYSCVASNSSGSTSSNEVPLAIVNSPTPGRLTNLSSRAFVGTGSDVMISGFIVSGPGSKQLILRGIGPALGSFGVSGTLVDPVLWLYDSASPSNLIVEDSGWQNPLSAPTGPWAGKVLPSDATAADFAQVGAFGLSAKSTDSAIKIILPAGGYTAQVTGATGTGVALAEVYDADTGTPTAQLVNLSSRALVGTGGNNLIAGFVIAGSTSETVLIRASGPALGAFGVPGVLPDPQLQLFDSNKDLVASSFGWAGNSQIASAAAAAGAFSWRNPASFDSAILVTLPPGGYTAEVSGQSGDTGVALIEVYAVPAVTN